MSHIGKTPVVYPKNISFCIDNNTLIVSGKYGKSSMIVPNNVDLTFDYKNNKIHVYSSNKSVWGATRSHLNNLIKGVSQGFVSRLRLEGLGYKVKLNNNTLNFKLGFSHDINLEVPFGITAKCPSQTRVDLFGINIENVNSFAMKIRNLRPPEPYKGKGVLFSGEVITKKVLKK